MRGRTILLAALLVAGFWYVAERSDARIGSFFRPLAETGRLWSAPDTTHGSGYETDEQNNIDIYKAARTATVNITSIVYQRGWFMQLMPAKGIGSGFIINEEGQILTNNHVVKGGQELTVTLFNHKQYRARVLGTDPRTDLALIQIKAPGHLPMLHLGNSDSLQVGQKVLAIGNPFGLEGTLTTGIVSSLGRSLGDSEEEGGHLEDLIQTDAAINPGNSGGPLLDSHGDVIGINTAILGHGGSAEGGNIGIGFATPISKAKAMLDEYRTKGRIARPVTGFTSVRIQGDLAQELNLPASGGLLVQSVEMGSSASEAGLRGPKQTVIVGNYQLGVGGDFIVAIDGKPVDENDAVPRAMAKKRAGDKLDLTVLRGSKQVIISFVLTEGPETL
jgi:S1-C subfamily serine protease